MSLQGRYIVDRLKRAVSRYLLLPVPPYESAHYWEGVYQSFGPMDVFEWGDLSFTHHLLQYQYTPLSIPPTFLKTTTTTTSAVHPSRAEQPAPQPLVAATTRTTTTWGETLNTFPVPENERKEESNINEPILILGCGNSKLGEDMLEPHRSLILSNDDDKSGNDHDNANNNLLRWRGPILQVDVSSRVIDAMGQRCNDYIQCGDMMVIQDDATELSSIANQTIHATIDKGLVDALFCANQPQLCYNVMQAVHRVLQPHGVFVIMSFSRPEFLLETLLVPPHLQMTNKDKSNTRIRSGGGGGSSNSSSKPSRVLQWGNIQVRQLDSILLYRFQKPMPVVRNINMSNFKRLKKQSRQGR